VPAEDREAPAEDLLEEFLVDRLKGVAHIYEVYVEIAHKIRVNMTFAKETAMVTTTPFSYILQCMHRRTQFGAGFGWDNPDQSSRERVRLGAG